jgi:hypothetical protein
MTRKIKADTQEIRNDTSAIKQDTAQILAEIACLQEQLPQGANRLNTSGFMLQRYLDNLTSYAETVCDTFPDDIENPTHRKGGFTEPEVIQQRNASPISSHSGRNNTEAEPANNDFTFRLITPTAPERPLKVLHPNHDRHEREFMDAWTRKSVDPEEVQELLRGCTLELKSRGMSMIDGLDSLLLSIMHGGIIPSRRVIQANWFSL